MRAVLYNNLAGEKKLGCYLIGDGPSGIGNFENDSKMEKISMFELKLMRMSEDRPENKVGLVPKVYLDRKKKLQWSLKTFVIMW